jgi:hypothetical protein
MEIPTRKINMAKFRKQFRLSIKKNCGKPEFSGQLYFIKDKISMTWMKFRASIIV